MPELPEVETMRRVIKDQICGRIIEKASLTKPGILKEGTADQLEESLTGNRIESLERRAKYLIMRLEQETLVFHMGMTGCLLVEPGDSPWEKHAHFVLRLDNGTDLRFVDPRRFGKLWFYADSINPIPCLEGLGLEPDDPQLSVSWLKQTLSTRKRAIKTCLLDQSVIAGIGNIYSDEILFKAGIDPALPACELSDPQWEKLAETIPERISWFIERNAISPEDYLQAKGQEYRNTPYLQVYGHAGKPCPICGTTLLSASINQRTSVFCPHCQHVHLSERPASSKAKTKPVPKKKPGKKSVSRKKKANDLQSLSLEVLWKLFPISLVTHDHERWTGQYQRMEAFLSEALKDIHPTRIEHIGSTAIASIDAKDIVDILVELPDSVSMKQVSLLLQKTELIEMSTSPERISLNAGYTEQGYADEVFHIHLRLSGDHDELYFRDYLNDHPQTAKEYEALKHRLMDECDGNRDLYTEGKTAFVQEISQKARQLYENRYEAEP